MYGIKPIMGMYLHSFRKIFPYLMEIESWLRSLNTQTRMGSRELIVTREK